MLLCTRELFTELEASNVSTAEAREELCLSV